MDSIESEIEEIIREKSGMDFGNLLRLTPMERGPSGRIVRLQIAGSKITLTIGKELEIRRLRCELNRNSRKTIKKGNRKCLTEY